MKIYAGDYADAADAAIIVVTAGAALAASLGFRGKEDDR